MTLHRLAVAFEALENAGVQVGRMRARDVLMRILPIADPDGFIARQIVQAEIVGRTVALEWTADIRSRCYEFAISIEDHAERNYIPPPPKPVASSAPTTTVFNPTRRFVLRRLKSISTEGS